MDPYGPSCRVPSSNVSSRRYNRDGWVCTYRTRPNFESAGGFFFPRYLPRKAIHIIDEPLELITRALFIIGYYTKIISSRGCELLCACLRVRQRAIMREKSSGVYIRAPIDNADVEK